jgi:hypothetical protein
MRSDFSDDVPLVSGAYNWQAGNPETTQEAVFLPHTMSGDSVRRLLPQSSQMQSFSFAPNNFGQRENQKSAHSLSCCGAPPNSRLRRY